MTFSVAPRFSRVSAHFFHSLGMEIHSPLKASELNAPGTKVFKEQIDAQSSGFYKSAWAVVEHTFQPSPREAEVDT